MAVVAIITAAVALLTVGEFLKLTESYGVKPLRTPTYGFVILFFLLLTLRASQEKPLLSTDIFGIAAAFAATIAAFVFLTIAMRRADLATGFPAAAASAFAFIYVALPLAMLVQLRQQWAASFLILYLLLVVWAGDILAYFVGKSVGRHLMAPRISPKKTWEGAAASLVASMAVGGAMFYYSSALEHPAFDWGLIEPEMESSASKGRAWRVRWSDGSLKCSRATGRSGRIADQTRRRCERFGHDSARARRDARSHRCPAFAAPVLWV